MTLTRESLRNELEKRNIAINKYIGAEDFDSLLEYNSLFPRFRFSSLVLPNNYSIDLEGINEINEV